MSERRSLGNAFRQTPEVKQLDERAMAFITGGVPAKGTTEPPKVKEVVMASPKEEAKAPVEPEMAAAPSELSPSEPKDSPVRRSRSRVSVSTPQPMNGKVFISVTTRLEQGTANALRRAYLEQKLKGALPATQQEIIEIALQAWLRDNDYL